MNATMDAVTVNAMADDRVGPGAFSATDDELAAILSRLSRQLTRLASAVDNLEADLAERLAAASPGPPPADDLAGPATGVAAAVPPQRD